MIQSYTKPWPWGHIPDPRPADWGIGMTVCIAAISEPEVGEQYIVIASDRMVSMGGYFSGDDIVRKVDPIGYGWTSMIAGNDVSPSVPILERVAEIAAERSHDDTQKEMSRTFRTAYRAQRLEMIEDEILSPLGFTWDTFRAEGRDQLSERLYERTIDKIRTYEVDVTFLVSGYDIGGDAHIFTVCNPGKCDYYEKLGFWAIGSGQHQAVASMFASHYHRHKSLETCVAQVLAAKLAAESAAGVGKETWLMINSAKDRAEWIHISAETKADFRKKWDALPKIPYDAVPVIIKNIEDEKKRIADEKRQKPPDGEQPPLAS